MATKTIKSTSYRNVLAENFDILIDANPPIGDPVMAILVEPKEGKKFLLPMDLTTARNMAVMMLDTLMKVSPHLVMDALR